MKKEDPNPYVGDDEYVHVFPCFKTTLYTLQRPSLPPFFNPESCNTDLDSRSRTDFHIKHLQRANGSIQPRINIVFPENVTANKILPLT